MVNLTKIRVIYADTDAMGIVYHTIHACTNMEGKVRRIPQMILDLKTKYNIKGE